MAWTKTGKRLRIKAGKALGKVMRKRYINKPTGALKLGQVIRDVAMVKKMVNAEKKHFGPTTYIEPVSTTNIFTVGLTNGAGEGMQMINITPQIIKGDNRDNRNGNSVKLVSGFVHINLAGQSAQANNSKLVFEIWQTKFKLYGLTPTPGVMGSDLFTQDPITGRYSSNCGRNPNFFKNFRLIRRQIVYTPQDNAGTSNFVRQVSLPFKLKQHLRWDDSNVGAAWTNTEYFLIVRSNNGNASPTLISSTSNAALGLNTAVNTGFQFQLYSDYYYYDN